MNVSKKNKLKYFTLYDSGLDQENAVVDIMRLFGIEVQEKESIREDEQTFPYETVLIKHVVVGNLLILEVWYRLEDGSLQQLINKQFIDTKNENKSREINRLIKVNLLQVMREATGYDPGPWGILKGVKPTKLVNYLLDEGMSRPTIIKHLMDAYCLEKDKASLLSDIAFRQRKFLPTVEKPANNVVSIYIGIPFCPSKCLYCSFPSYILSEDRSYSDVFLKALARDMEDMADFIDRNRLLVQNVYIGGGTPTSLKGKDFAWLLSKVKDFFITDFTHEYTVEAGRPDSIDDEQIGIMTGNQVTRVSVNPQTMQEKTLKYIGRRHTVQDIIDVFYKIRRANIPSINMDVIAGLPGETPMDMESTMEQLALLNPENLTVHTLAIKRGSALKDHLAEYRLPNADATRDMLHIAADFAQRMHMRPYYLYRQKYMTGNMENIGFCKEGKECLYNVQMIEERQTILGMGPAAATKAVNTNNWHLDSFYNPKDLQTYIKNLETYLARRRKILSKLFSNGKED